MTNKELIDLVSKSLQEGMISPPNKAAVTKTMDTAFLLISDALSNGNEVKITGFGAFEVTQVAARIGRNPSTGASVEIPAKQRIKFKPSSVLKNLM